MTCLDFLYSCQERIADTSSCFRNRFDQIFLLLLASGTVLTSCILVRKGQLTRLLASCQERLADTSSCFRNRFDQIFLLLLASGTVLIKFQSKMPNLVHFKQSKNFFRRTTIKTRLLKRKTVKNNQKTELYLQLSSKSPATKSSHDTS